MVCKCACEVEQGNQFRRRRRHLGRGHPDEIVYIRRLWPVILATLHYSPERAMTEQTDNRQPDTTAAEQANTSAAPSGLGALFAAASKQAGKSAQPKQGKGGFDPHTKRVHMPPRGTRRSMGKR
ncbi:MAG: hypothetical protein VW877_15135 [Pseudomonadaceae bacterium]